MAEDSVIPPEACDISRKAPKMLPDRSVRLRPSIPLGPIERQRSVMSNVLVVEFVRKIKLTVREASAKIVSMSLTL